MSGFVMPVAPLFVPGDRPERFSKAGGSQADAVILDLEDAVAVGRKEFARGCLNSAFTQKPVIVRINGETTPWHDADLDAASKIAPAALMLPKVQDVAIVERLHAKTGLPLLALIETAAGLANVRSIAAARGIAGLAFGSIDFCADIGCAHSGTALLHARSEIVLAARIGRLPPPLDGVTGGFSDSAATSEDALHACELGFGGKLCIHPSQVPAVLSAFQPSAEQIAWAECILRCSDGAQTVNGEMVDEPVRVRARKISELATKFTR